MEIEFTVLDHEFIQGKSFVYRNMGKAVKGGKTDKYEVTYNGRIIGSIKWFPVTKTFAFFNINTILSSYQLFELYKFIEYIDKKRIAGLKPRVKKKLYYRRTWLKPTQKPFKFPEEYENT